jgi:transposase
MRKKTVETRKDRQTFSETFKADAVRMVMHSGKSMETVVNSVGVSYSALVRWVADAKKGKHGSKRC